MTQTLIATKPATEPGKPKAPTRKRRRSPEKSCSSCFFGANGLCALGLDQPCPTYRPNSPAGLVPPRQPALLVRPD